MYIHVRWRRGGRAVSDRQHAHGPADVQWHACEARGEVCSPSHIRSSLVRGKVCSPFSWILPAELILPARAEPREGGPRAATRETCAPAA